MRTDAKVNFAPFGNGDPNRPATVEEVMRAVLWVYVDLCERLRLAQGQPQAVACTQAIEDAKQVLTTVFPGYRWEPEIGPRTRD